MNKFRFNSLPVLQGSFACYLALTGISSPVLSQEGYQVEEIIVSARRREENLQDVPDTVKVFNSELIENTGISNVQDVTALTPNMAMSNDQEPGVTTLTMRGISSVRNSDAPVAFVVDGVTAGSALTLGQELFDVQQIEVLKGPQGALYGRNSIAGAIVVTTKKPTNETELDINASVSEGGYYRVGLNASGAIVEDTLLYRASVSYQDGGDHWRNIFLQEDVGGREVQSGKIKLIYTPSDTFEADFRFFTTTLEEVNGRWTVENNGAVEFAAQGLPFHAGFIEDGLGRIQTDLIGSADLDFSETSLKLEWDTSIGTLTSVTGYTDLSTENTQSLDYHPTANLGVIATEDANVLTQEFRLTSPGDQSVRWNVGAFWQEQERDRLFEIFVPSAAGYDGPTLCCTRPAPILAPSQLNNTAWAVFGQANIDITDYFELTLAGRYDVDDREEGLVGVEEKFSKFQPKVSVAYKPVDDLTVYGTYAVGFRSGGFNQTDTFGLQYDSESTDNFEIGAKGAFADGLVTYNLAAYYISFEDQQTFLWDGGAQSAVNIEDSEIRGVELELQASLSEGLDLTAALGYQDSEIKDPGDFPVTSVGIDPINDFTGRTLPLNPDFSAAIAMQYIRPMSNGLESLFRVDYEYRGKTYWWFNNDDVQDSFSLVNLRAGIQSDNWSASVYVNNLTDERYQTFFFPNEAVGGAPHPDIGWYGEPRVWGLDLRYSF